MRTYKKKYNRALNEWRVKFYIDGIYQKGADYFTDCKEDAKDTGEYFVKGGK